MGGLLNPVNDVVAIMQIQIKFQLLSVLKILLVFFMFVLPLNEIEFMLLSCHFLSLQNIVLFCIKANFKNSWLKTKTAQKM